MSASLRSTEPVQERAARQINACVLLLYPSVLLEVTPALLALHNRPRLPRRNGDQQNQTNTYRGLSSSCHTAVSTGLQDTERPGSISALFMSVNCLAQEQFLVPVCLDCSQKQREIPSQVGWQPAITEQGLAKSPWQSLQS